MNKTVKFGMMVVLGAIALCAPRAAEAKFTKTNPVLKAVMSKGSSNSLYSKVDSDYNQINSYANATLNSISTSAASKQKTSSSSTVTKSKTTTVAAMTNAKYNAIMSSTKTTYNKSTASVPTSVKTTIYRTNTLNYLSKTAASRSSSFGNYTWGAGYYNWSQNNWKF